MYNDRNILVDYGWIEDSKGRTIWKMDIMKSRHAGGASKNQVEECEIVLSPGDYLVRYISDESHSWNNWDDLPPNSTFYGIKIQSTD